MKTKKKVKKKITRKNYRKPDYRRIEFLLSPKEQIKANKVAKTFKMSVNAAAKMLVIGNF